MRSCAGGWLTSAVAGMARVGVESVAGSAVAGVAAWWLLDRVGDVLGPDPGRLILLVALTVVSAAFGAVYALVSAALRIPELPSIVGVMVDAFRRPVRS